MALQAGHLFGNYRIVRLLGQGGFGEVYLAENPLIQRRAAVKVLHTALAQDSDSVRRFLNEARAASAIRHGNIIDVFDAGVTPEGAPYILMEFLEGVSLHKRLTDKGRLALPQVFEIARQAGSALAAAHAAGIVHRDLKPENIFLVREPGLPGGERVKILDFGIAKIRHSGDPDGTSQTQTGLIMGSPSYMSPEQCRDSADVDLRSDIYSFAIIVYKMLAGRTPYVGASGAEMLLKHLSETPPPLRSWVPDVPAHVEAAVMRGLARARAERFDSMAAFITALRGNGNAEVPAAGRSSPSADFPAVDQGPGAGAEETRTATKMLSAAGEARATGDGTLVAATRILPADPDSLAARAQGTIAGPANTTFSRATGELERVTVARTRRWPFIAMGGVALAGLVLLLVRFNRGPQSDTPGIAAADAALAGGVAISGLEPPANPVATAPSRADAGVAPAAAAIQPEAKPAPAAATHRHSNAAKHGAAGNHSASPSPVKKQDDVAGF